MIAKLMEILATADNSEHTATLRSIQIAKATLYVRKNVRRHAGKK